MNRLLSRGYLVLLAVIALHKLAAWLGLIGTVSQRH